MKFLKKFLKQINRDNIKLFIFYTRKYGLKYTLQLSLMFLEGKGALPSFLKKWVRDPNYKKWISKNEPTKTDLEIQTKNVSLFKYQPLISIVVPIHDAPLKMLTEMIESVIAQTYPNWELCIADGNSQKLYVKGTLSSYAQRDKRIKLKFLSVNKGIVGNTNEAISITKGEFIAFLDYDGLLAPFALYEVVKLLNEKPNLDFIYSDEDKISENSKIRFDPFFKPDWGPSLDTLRSQNYFCHLAVIRKSFLDKIGWFREGFEGSQDYELFLRVIENTDKIGHIPKILYHWRSHETSTASGPVKTYAIISAQKALQEHLKRQGIKGEVAILSNIGRYRVLYEIEEKPLISIIIPTRDKVDILKKCIDSILEKSTYKKFEILIVNNQSRELSTLKYFQQIKKFPFIKIIDYNKSFNYSALNNYAVKYTNGEILLFLNNDTEVINSDWLEAMLEHAQRKEIGAVGAKLYYYNDTIQNAGIVIGISGLCGESYKFFDREHGGYMNGLKIIHNVSAVTGACLMIRKEVFQEVGGFDENLQVAYNDVDLCLKIREKGYLIIWTPFAELYHHEKLTRGRPSSKEKWELEIKEREYFKAKWRHLIEKGDPYYNPNLNQDCADFSLKL